MTTIEKIRSAASNGLTRAEVIATVLNGHAMTDAEQSAFDKARGIWKLREAKRKAEKKEAIRNDRARMRAARDASVAIDAKLVEARTKIDWKRRKKAEKSLAAWLSTYGLGVFVDDPPPKPHGVKILAEMEEAVGSSRPYQVLVARGGGKTSYTEAAVAYLIATGRKRFCLISSINAKQAQQILREITAVFTEEPFATDYPDIAVPIRVSESGRTSEFRVMTRSPVSTFGVKVGLCLPRRIIAAVAAVRWAGHEGADRDGRDGPSSHR